MSVSPRILYCHCAYARVVPEEIKEAVLERLSREEIAFDAVADLCEMSAKGDPTLQTLVESPCLKIAACYPRAVKWLFASAGAPLPAERVEVLNMRTQTADEVAERLLADDLRPMLAEQEETE